MGMDEFSRKARRHPKLLSEGISLRLLELSVGNSLPLATICFSFRAGYQLCRIYFTGAPLVQDETRYRILDNQGSFAAPLFSNLGVSCLKLRAWYKSCFH
jgi:hypothetical protein